MAGMSALDAAAGAARPLPIWLAQYNAFASASLAASRGVEAKRPEASLMRQTGRPRTATIVYPRNTISYEKTISNRREGDSPCLPLI